MHRWRLSKEFSPLHRPKQTARDRQSPDHQRRRQVKIRSVAKPHLTARAGLQIGSNSLAVTGNLEGWKTVSGTGTRPAITCLHILPWQASFGHRKGLQQSRRCWRWWWEGRGGDRWGVGWEREGEGGRALVVES